MSADFTLPPLKVFISYAREDETCCKKLKNHLTSLDGKLIEIWYDRKIIAGEEWDAEIKRKLNESEIILLLVSSDFNGSKYCQQVEVKTAIERYKKGEVSVIPIIVKSVYWKPKYNPLAELETLPQDAKPVHSKEDWGTVDEAWVNVVEGIEKAAEKLQQRKELQRKEILEQVDKQPDCVIDSLIYAMGDSQLLQINNKEHLKSLITQQSSQFVALTKNLSTFLKAVHSPATDYNFPSVDEIVARNLSKNLSELLEIILANSNELTVDQLKNSFVAPDIWEKDRFEDNKWNVALMLCWWAYYPNKVDLNKLLGNPNLSSEVKNKLKSLLGEVKQDPIVSENGGHKGNCLLVRVKYIDAVEKNNIQIDAWAETDTLSGDEQFKYLGQEWSCTVNEIGAKLEEIIKKCNKFESFELKKIEIFLPIELLSCDANSWMYKFDDELFKIWAEWEVIFRSYERCYSDKHKIRPDRWKDNWRRIFAKESLTKRFALPTTYNIDGINKDLEGKVWGIFMKGDVRFITKTIVAGIPILVWPRTEIKLEVDALVKTLCPEENSSEDQALLKMPNIIHKLRRTASPSNPDDLGHHLILLWDDPHRVPKSDKLTGNAV